MAGARSASAGGRHLIAPEVDLYEQWAECHRNWGPGLHEDGFGIISSDDVEGRAGFARWVDRILGERHTIHRWIVDNEVIVGAVALRTGPQDLVHQLGHIGFGVRPSARRRGHAAWALSRTLEIAAEQDLERVVLICASDNVGSARTIASRGGVLVGEETTPLGLAHRYVISVAREA